MSSRGDTIWGQRVTCRGAHRGVPTPTRSYDTNDEGVGCGAWGGPPRRPRDPVPQTIHQKERVGGEFGPRDLPFAKPALAADGRSMRLAHRPPPGGVVAPPGPPQCTPHVPWMATIFRFTAAIFCFAQSAPRGPHSWGPVRGLAGAEASQRRCARPPPSGGGPGRLPERPGLDRTTPGRRRVRNLIDPKGL